MRRFALLLVVLLIFSGCSGKQGVETVNRYPHENLMFTTSETCKKCHGGIFVDDEDVSMYFNWNQAMLSLSAKDPYFIAKMRSESAKFPELDVEIKCLTCHEPMAVTQAKKDNGDVKTYPELAADGVSCTLCHQIKGDNLGKEESFSGGYVIDFAAKKPDRPIYGPYIPVWANIMQRESGYLPVKGGQIRKAELCAVCHTLYTPTVRNGKVVGSFPEQTPFLEWLNSDYFGNKTCQDCHMPVVEAKISTKPANLKARMMRIHEFAGGNVQMLKLLGRDEGAVKSEEKLKDAAKVVIKSIRRENGKIVVEVEVRNFAGHKFPAGFPSRRAFIHLTAYDGDRIIFESGKYYGDGRIEGEDRPFEKHHDVIDDEGMVQIYEAVMSDSNGNVTYTLLEAAGYVKDNRLLPSGFSAQTAHVDTRVIGAARDDDNFVGGKDVVTYILPPDTGRVKVELLYQPISYPFLEGLRNDLKKFGIREIGEFLKLYDGADKTTLVSSDEKVVGS